MDGKTLSAVVLCALCSVCGVATAQTCDVSWDSGGTTVNWSDDPNWDGDTQPISTDSVCHDDGSDIIIVDVGTPLNPEEIAAFNGDGGSNRGLTIGDSAARGLKVLGDFIGTVAGGNAYDITVAAESLLWGVGSMEATNILVESGTSSDPSTLLIEGDLATTFGTTLTLQPASSGALPPSAVGRRLPCRMRPLVRP